MSGNLGPDPATDLDQMKKAVDQARYLLTFRADQLRSHGNRRGAGQWEDASADLNWQMEALRLGNFAPTPALTGIPTEDIPSLMEEVRTVLTKLIAQRDGHYGVASEWDEARVLLAKLEGK